MDPPKVLYTDRDCSKFIARYKKTGCFNRAVGSGRPTLVNAEVKKIVEQQMQKDDETSAHQLFRLLIDNGYNLSLQTILRCRSSLGWTFRGSAYCQLIRHVNKTK